MRPAFLLTCALLCLTATPATAQPASPEERAAAIARPAIVYVRTSWHGWVRDRRTGEVFGGAEGYRFTTTCSGAVINGDGYVATASHCVDPGVDGGGRGLLDMAVVDLALVGRVRDPALATEQLAEHASLEGAEEGSPIGREIQVERGTGPDDRDVAPASVVDLTAPTNGDIALLKVPRSGLPAVELVTGDVPVGTPVLAIGYPASTGEVTDPTLEPSSKNGQVSNHRTQGGKPFHEISAAVTQGMSGGPVVDMRGQVIGLISQLSPGEPQAFNLAASAETLAGLLRDANVDGALGPTDRNYRTGLEAYFTADYDTAVEYLDAVLAAAPGHPQATRYRERAVAQGGGASGNGLLVVLVAVCAGLAVLAGAGGFVLLARHRRMLLMSAPTPPYGIPIPKM
jgi:S1-C subfamily serine protease